MKNRKLCCFGAGALVCLLLLAGSAQAATYNLSDDFTNTDTLTSIWGASGGPSTSLATYDTSGSGSVTVNSGMTSGWNGLMSQDKFLVQEGEILTLSITGLTSANKSYGDSLSLYSANDNIRFVINDAEPFGEVVFKMAANGGTRFYKVLGTTFSGDVDIAWAKLGTSQYITLTQNGSVIFDTRTDAPDNGSAVTDWVFPTVAMPVLFDEYQFDTLTATSINVTSNSIPEPATMSLLGLGGLVTILRKRRS